MGYPIFAAILAFLIWYTYNDDDSHGGTGGA